MILARQDVVEYIKRACLRNLRQFIRAPGLANFAFGGVAIARSNQSASKCKPTAPPGSPLGTRAVACPGSGLQVFRDGPEHGRRICLLLPET